MSNERSSAIVGNHWDALDFGEIEAHLAAGLSDADIERVLLCIDAVNNLKRLKLTNCIKITGTCLVPLRGSTIIEQIDLSLDEQNADIIPALPISCDHVLPILDSIIEREDCELRHLRFPSMWRKEPSTDSAFHAFIGRYNEMKRNMGRTPCLECNRSLPTNDGGIWIETDDEDDDYYGTILHTCCGCLKHYCYVCNIGEEEKLLQECGTCERDYCRGCWEMTECSFCHRGMCNDCYKWECFQCNEVFCSGCIDEGGCLRKCDYCDKFCCEHCHYEEAVDIIYTCNRCDVKCCKDCGLQRYRQGQLHCAGCIKESVSVLEHQRLQEENEELKVEMEALKRQNEDLKHENEELRSRNIE